MFNSVANFIYNSRVSGSIRKLDEPVGPIGKLMEHVLMESCDWLSVRSYQPMLILTRS